MLSFLCSKIFHLIEQSALQQGSFIRQVVAQIFILALNIGQLYLVLLVVVYANLLETVRLQFFEEIHVKGLFESKVWGSQFSCLRIISIIYRSGIAFYHDRLNLLLQEVIVFFLFISSRSLFSWLWTFEIYISLKIVAQLLIVVEQVQ